MSERWVKATGCHPKVASKETVWVNMAQIVNIYPEGPGSVLFTADHFDFVVKEPPEHFLPPSTLSHERAMDFLKLVAAIPMDEAASPSLVRDAQGILAEVNALTAQAWAVRYGT